jgi:polyhydroxyalkanoate synthase
MDMAEPLDGQKARSVLGASRHIAGAINPQANDKRSYWIDGTSGNHAETRLTIAQALAGSWWSHWPQWLKSRLGKSVPAQEARQHPAQPAGACSGAPCERENQSESAPWACCVGTTHG